ncbi:MAG: hypothetical protein RR804_18250, partial [Massilia sp.]
LLRVGDVVLALSDGRLASQRAQADGVRNLVLTHFSPRYQEGGAMPLSLIDDEARAHYRGNLLLARDLDHYVLDRSGVLEYAGQ